MSRVKKKRKGRARTNGEIQEDIKDLVATLTMRMIQRYAQKNACLSHPLKTSMQTAWQETDSGLVRSSPFEFIPLPNDCDGLGKLQVLRLLGSDLLSALYGKSE